jgi:hypothetical protein
MAHDCPNCYEQCHCGGDIDDINFGEDGNCTHYDRLECDAHREYCSKKDCLCHQLPDDEDSSEYAENPEYQ